ncbi:MAG: transposase [Myxococcaceae bacterium]|nr:transposase [Myxococcaceae bacterium]
MKAECRLRRKSDDRYEYTPKKGVAFTLTPEVLVRRLVALVPPAKLHLTCFHGVYAPHAVLRPLVTQPHADKAQPSTAARRKAKTKQKTKRRLDWAMLHQRTFGTDVLACPCGGRRTIRALHSTRKQASGAPGELGHHHAFIEIAARHRPTPTELRRLKGTQTANDFDCLSPALQFVFPILLLFFNRLVGSAA